MGVKEVKQVVTFMEEVEMTVRKPTRC